MTRKKVEMKIGLKDYNNKSRKGLYISIKARGKPTRLYKYTGKNTEIDATKKYYEDKYIRNKPLAKSRSAYTIAYEKSLNKEKDKSKQRIRVRRQADQYIAKIRRQRPIDTAIKNGIAKTTLEAPEKKSSLEIKNTIKRLLSQLVLDKDLIEILAQDQNLEKIKHRFEYQLNIRNEKGESVMILNKFNENPSKVMTQIKNSIDIGENIENKGYKSITATKLKNYNWNLINDYTTKNGNIRQTTLTITFRK